MGLTSSAQFAIGRPGHHGADQGGAADEAVSQRNAVRLLHGGAAVVDDLGDLHTLGHTSEQVPHEEQ